VPCLRIDNMTVAQKRAYVIADTSDLALIQWTVQKDPVDRCSKSAGLMLPR
jgi:hypothetical protein